MRRKTRSREENKEGNHSTHAVTKHSTLWRSPSQQCGGPSHYELGRKTFSGLKYAAA